MDNFVGIQHWLYRGIGDGLASVAGGDYGAIIFAMAAAILFGAVHALMPGHGKMVLVSYHLGQPSSPTTAFTNGALLALAHVALAAVLVLAGYAVISRAFAFGGRTPQFEAASGVLITLIGAYLLWTSLTHRHDAAPKGRSLALATGMIPCPLTTFVLSYAVARGVLASGLLVTAAMTVGMIVAIGGIALIAAFSRDRLLRLLARTEGWRHRAGMVLELGGAVLVLLLGVSTLLGSMPT